jgi:hypothetical protein
MILTFKMHSAHTKIKLADEPTKSLIYLGLEPPNNSIEHAKSGLIRSMLGHQNQHQAQS